MNALLGNNKFGMMDNTWKKESFTIELGNQRNKVNVTMYHSL